MEAVMSKVKFSNDKIQDVDRNIYGHNLWLWAAIVCWVLVVVGLVLLAIGINGWAFIFFGGLPALAWSNQAWTTHKENK